jgi:ribonucleoside-diphosphate reductase alpha chain
MFLKIIKRNGEETSFNPQKIYTRIKKAAKGLNVNPDEIFITVITSVPTEGEITTKQLDKLIADISASYTGNHHDYSRLAAQTSISSFHKETLDSFYETMKVLNDDKIINDEMVKKIENYGPEKIDSLINHEMDFNFDYFAWRSLHEMYLLKKSNGVVFERPQHMYMRVAVWVTDTFEDAAEYYKSLSTQTISPATPIMINSGTKVPQLSSCVLHYNNGDSRDGLLDTMRDISTYSSDAAGIGLCMSNIRSKESRIAGSGGYAGGLLKYLKIVNESLRFFNQQGRRPGSAAIYIEPWHKDIFDLLDIKKNTGADELRARDLFTALWIPDNFMEAVKADGDWYLFCPNDIKKSGLKALQECFGEEYESVYQQAVSMGLGKKVKALDVWMKIIESQVETGVPYLASKDSANKKTNHQNIGVIRQSNLCIEIFQATDEETTAICTLSSLVLKNYIEKGSYNFQKLFDETRKIVRALNIVIDVNSYSTEKGRKGGLEQRAIGIGTQGLADVFFLLDMIFDSEEAKILNKKIFETIYYAALFESNQLCKSGKYEPYKFYEGSPISEGKFQFDLWGLESSELSGLWDWDSLRKSIAEHGICNSLVTAQMPVASSAKITGSFEMTEPAHSALFNRRVVGGEILIVNKYLIQDFEKLGIWGEDLKNDIIMNDGSIQNINFNHYLDPEDKGYDKKVQRIEHLIKKYKTVWEIPQKSLIDMAADRAPYIDQSQSMNLYMSNPSVSKISSAHFYSWSKGLKTLSYYLRTKAISTGAKHLAMDIERKSKPKSFEQKPEIIQATKPDNSDFECFGCSS